MITQLIACVMPNLEAGGETAMQLSRAIRHVGTARITIRTLLRCVALLIFQHVLQSARGYRRIEMKVASAGITAGQSFMQKENGGQLISVKQINTPVLRRTISAIIPQTESNSVVAEIWLSKQDQNKVQSTFLPIQS